MSNVYLSPPLLRMFNVIGKPASAGQPVTMDIVTKSFYEFVDSKDCGEKVNTRIIGSINYYLYNYFSKR